MLYCIQLCYVGITPTAETCFTWKHKLNITELKSTLWIILSDIIIYHCRSLFLNVSMCFYKSNCCFIHKHTHTLCCEATPLMKSSDFQSVTWIYRFSRFSGWKTNWIRRWSYEFKDWILLNLEPSLRVKSRLTCDASWEKMASKVKVFGAEAEDRLWAAAVCPPAVVSQRVSSFFLPSTLSRDMDSEDSLLWTEQIRTITLTWRQTGSPHQRGRRTMFIKKYTPGAFFYLSLWSKMFL